MSIPETIRPVAAALRQATKAAHHALDHHPVLAPLVKNSLTLQDYARALAGLHAPQARLESLLVPWLASGSGSESGGGTSPSLPASHEFPPRLGALDADLEHLKKAPYPEMAVFPFPPWTGTDPSGAAAAGLIGVMYVLEGATQGALVIAREIAAHLPAAPRQFFADGNGALRWPAFWQRVDRQLPGDPVLRAEETNLACQAALATFDYYCAHLSGCLSSTD